MTFKQKYLVKNIILKGLIWLCGLTSLTIAYGFIKWQKLVYYGHWMFENLNFQNSDSWEFLHQYYFRVGSFSILWCLIFALMVDFFVIKTVVKV